jgi:RecA-family ATPase
MLNNEFDNLPDEMRNSGRWLLWKSEPNPDPTKKPRKVPYYADGQRRKGVLDSPTDMAKLATFNNALLKGSLLAASGGVGKSFLLLGLAHGVAKYEKQSLSSFSAFGKISRGGVAVMVCAEDDAIEVHNRLAGFGELPEQGRLIVVPLPDVGMRSLFDISATTKSPETTEVFSELHNQLKSIKDLSLVVIDPLQALCGGLDLNLPQHGQFVCGALNQLAADNRYVLFS